MLVQFHITGVFQLKTEWLAPRRHVCIIWRTCVEKSIYVQEIEIERREERNLLMFKEVIIR